MARSRTTPASRSRKTPSLASKRMAEYRARLRAAGLKPVQLWLPDTKDPKFLAACRNQSRHLAASDPAGDELMAFIEAIGNWPPG